MKKISIIILTLFMISCGSNEMTEKEATGKIQEYKAQIAELNKKISELKKFTKDTTSGNALKIRVLEVEATDFKKFFTTSGSLEAVQAANISPEMNGQVKQIFVKEGNFVKKGQILARLNDNVLKKNLVELETSLKLAEVLYKKQSELWEQKIGSEIEYLQAKNNKESLENRIESLKAQLELTKIKAPVSGIVDAVNIKKGELASPGMPIINVVNLSKMYVNTNVSESYLSALKKGDIMTVTFPTYPGLEIEADINYIGNVINPGNRTVKVQAIINNSNNKLKPNMIANVRLKDFEGENVIAIPSIVIRKDLEGAYIYMVEEKNNKKVAQKHYVKTGKSNNEKTIVTQGLETGDIVITDGFHLVKNGTEVNY